MRHNPFRVGSVSRRGQFRDQFPGSWRPFGWRHWWDRLALSQVRPNHPAFKIMRQCWVTPAKVWRLAAMFTGPIRLDPFYSPFSHIAKGRYDTRLDGSFGRDGFNLENWKGRGVAGVNGPWSATGSPRQPFRRAWLPLVAEYGEEEAAAAVVKAGTEGWHHDVFWANDLAIVPKNRIAFEMPFPALQNTRAPGGGSFIGLWLPRGPANWPRVEGGKTLWSPGGRHVPLFRPFVFDFEGDAYQLFPGRGRKTSEEIK